jgi:serine/threonine protein kinase
MEEIGHGNQSKVHLAKDHRDMRCCVKTCSKTDMDWQGVEMLKDECDVLCNLATHPNIASAINIFQDSNSYYVVLELYDGGDFTTLRSRATKTDVHMCEAWWQGVFEQAFQGLAHLHEHALIHSDIKEPNIMLKTCQYEQPKVTIIDFGLVRSAAGADLAICGTAGYMAPEVWEFGKLYPGSDIFSLGVVIMQMLLDKIPPHHNPPACEVLPGGIFTDCAKTYQSVKIATCVRTPPFDSLRGDFPWLANLTERLLNKDVCRRPCAKQVLRDMHCMAGDGIQERSEDTILGFLWSWLQ